MRYGVTARRKRNVRRVAGLQALRQARRDYRRAAGKAEIVATEAETSGALVIEAKGIGKAFGERPIVKDLSLRVMRGDRIGIVGPNGSGKTTLVGLLTGALAPDSGSVRLGANLAMANLDQGRESLDPNWTLSEALTGGRGDTVTVGGQTKHVVGYMQDFLFSPQQARTALSALSGGERGRLMLARALAKPSNLLVLDEPTNDLDLETLDVLEEMLGAYAGTVILISHDRDFLDRVVNLVLAPEGDGRWTEYAGGYSDMLAQRGADLDSRKPQKAKTAPAAKPASAAAAPPAKRKLSFNDQHALKTLPKQIATLQARIRELAGAARRSGALRARPHRLRRGHHGAGGRAGRARGRGREMAGARDAARGHRRRVTRTSSTCHPGTRASAYPGPRATNSAHLSWVPDIRLRRVPG